MEPKKTGLIYLIALFVLTTYVTLINSKAIIWDLGDTLISTNKFGLATKIGLSDLFFSFLFYNYSQEQIQYDIFYFLDLASQKDRHNPQKKRKYHPQSPDGHFLPEIMCDWLEGKISHCEISTKVKSCLNYYRSSSCADGLIEWPYRKRIIQNSIDAIFNPEILGKNMYPIEPALYLLDKCANQINSIGCYKHDMFILSNFEAETFKYFKNTYAGKKILRYFKSDHIVLSGDAKIAKPNPEIYEYLLKKFRLDPKNCIFIDDQLENIKTAQKLGIDALHLNNQNYYVLQKQLEYRKVI